MPTLNINQLHVNMSHMHVLWLFLVDFEQNIRRVAVQDKLGRIMKSC